MGHARGVVLLNIQRAGLELLELGATEVKKSLTGNGHASKQQVQEGVRVQLGLSARPEPADVADAMAVAMCALRRVRGDR
jgi:crossover junction endodeoxyribonuclease RuvC